MAEQGSLASLAGRPGTTSASSWSTRDGLTRGRPCWPARSTPAVATNYERHRAHGALGFAALSGGDPATAVGHLDRWHAVLTAMHLREPGYSRWHLDYLAALVATAGWPTPRPSSITSTPWSPPPGGARPGRSR